MSRSLVAVRGGGDLGTGVAIRLWRSGFDVVVLEIPTPLAVRRTVSFSEAVYEDKTTVEGVHARLAKSMTHAAELEGAGVVPVLVDPDAGSVGDMRPQVLVDAILAKRNTGTSKSMARLVIGLGPGFEAGTDVHAVVETNRGPDLGRVLWRGTAERNTGAPAPVLGHAADRVLRAPAEGGLQAHRKIGDVVDAGETVASVEGQPLSAPFRGMVRGLLRDGARVPAGLKIGDLDPRIDPSLCLRVSDKSLAIAGGVLEAILAHENGRLP